MKKINYLLLFACSPFLIQSAQALENSVFNDTASFTLAKAVKLGRSATSLGNSSSELRDKLSPIGGNQSNACYTGYYDSGGGGGYYFFILKLFARFKRAVCCSFVKERNNSSMVVSSDDEARYCFNSCNNSSIFK